MSYYCNSRCSMNDIQWWHFSTTKIKYCPKLNSGKATLSWNYRPRPKWHPKPSRSSSESAFSLRNAARHQTAPRVPQHKWLPTAPGVCSQCVCALGWVNTEHEFWVWVNIFGCMSLSLSLSGRSLLWSSPQCGLGRSADRGCILNVKWGMRRPTAGFLKSFPGGPICCRV